MVILQENKDKIAASEKQIIRNYFESWIKKDFANLDQWFQEDMFYRECYGATYQGLDELKAYIKVASKRQTVLKWAIFKIEQTVSGQFVVTWFFKAKEEKEYCFDGVSLIDFAGLKIKRVVEYSTKHETYRPYECK